MRLDRHDIFPFTVILIFGLVIPLAGWLGLGSRQQIILDLSNLAKDFTIASLAFAIFIGFLAIRSHRREKRVLIERGEQVPSHFAALFADESEQHAANLLFERLRRMTATGRMPRLEREDQLSGPPLFLDPADLAEQLEELCRELDICTALDPDAKAALYNAKTVSQLVSALAHFIQQQGLKSA